MAKEQSFPAANVTVNDVGLRIGDGQYEWPEIMYAEVVTKRYPINWRTFLQVYVFVFLGFALFWAVAPWFGWYDLPGPVVALFWLLITVLAARDQVKRSYRHTLTLETVSGNVEVATSDYDDPLLEACEAINRRIKRYAASPGPMQSGEPTRWIQAR